MTKDKAIELLDCLLGMVDDNQGNDYDEAFHMAIDALKEQPEQQWKPCERELPSDNREVEVTCKVRRLDGKAYEYTCHASYVHRYSIESTDYCNWEECDEYNEEEDKYYALPGWYERVHNWDDYSYCAIEDFVTAWRELPEPWRGEEDEHTMEEFMYGQDIGNPDDGSL